MGGFLEDVLSSEAPVTPAEVADLIEGVEVEYLRQKLAD